MQIDILKGLLTISNIWFLYEAFIKLLIAEIHSRVADDASKGERPWKRPLCLINHCGMSKSKIYEE